MSEVVVPSLSYRPPGSAPKLVASMPQHLLPMTVLILS